MEMMTFRFKDGIRRKSLVRFIESFTTEDESTREKEAGQIWNNVVIVCKVQSISVHSFFGEFQNIHFDIQTNVRRSGIMWSLSARYRVYPFNFWGSFKKTFILIYKQMFEDPQ